MKSNKVIWPWYRLFNVLHIQTLKPANTAGIAKAAPLRHLVDLLTSQFDAQLANGCGALPMARKFSFLQYLQSYCSGA